MELVQKWDLSKNRTNPKMGQDQLLSALLSFKIYFRFHPSERSPGERYRWRSHALLGANGLHMGCSHRHLAVCPLCYNEETPPCPECVLVLLPKAKRATACKLILALRRPCRACQSCRSRRRRRTKRRKLRWKWTGCHNNFAAPSQVATSKNIFI